MSVAARIKAVRKDGESITFTDYKGNQKTDKYAPVATIWRDDETGRLSLKFEKGFTGFKDLDSYWFNYYEEKQGDRQPQQNQAQRNSGYRNERRDDDKVPF